MSKSALYGKPPFEIGHFDFDLPEMMHFLYLPVIMGDTTDIRLPRNLEVLRPMIRTLAQWFEDKEYCYVSAVRGVASPGNALNRPGWHCDGFGTEDVNAIWWKGPGTRFAVQDFTDITEDDALSMDQFEAQVRPDRIEPRPPGFCYILDPYVVHAVPLITHVCERQFVKLSFSDDKYNLKGNSHNYLFDYAWEMKARAPTRNITSK